MKLKRIKPGRYEGPGGYTIERGELAGFIDLLNPDKGIHGGPVTEWRVKAPAKPGRKWGKTVAVGRTLKEARVKLARRLERSRSRANQS